MIALVGLFGAACLLVLSAGHALADPPDVRCTPESKPDGFFNALLFMLVLAGVVAHHYKRKANDDE